MSKPDTRNTFAKIVAHVRTCLGLIEKTLNAKRLPKWEAKTPVESSPFSRTSRWRNWSGNIQTRYGS